MDTFLIDMGLSIVITLLKGLKGAKKKAQLKAVFLKIHKLIFGIYGDDAEFQAVWGTSEE